METALIVVMSAWFVGGFITGVGGVGGAMFAVPIAALFLPIQDVIVLSCILNMAMDITLTVMHFRFCRVSAMWPMLIGTIPGTLVGLFLLLLIPEAVLQGMVGVFLLSFLFWQKYCRGNKKGQESWLAGGIAGCASGVLGAAISFDSPPVGAYGLYVGWTPRVLLGTLGVYFIIRGVFTCVLQASSGLFSPEIVQYVLFAFPVTMLGTACSFPVVKRVNQETFNKVLRCIIATGALICMYRATGI